MFINCSRLEIEACKTDFRSFGTKRNEYSHLLSIK